jgi:hypothetical protein
VSTDVGIGDSETPWIVVAPADNTTQAALVVTAPDGTSTSIAATGGSFVPIDGSSDEEQRWTANQPVVYDQPGLWVLRWDITGTGQGAEDLEVFVVPSPVAGGPTWTPGRSRVANYVPHRTLARSTSSIIDSQDNYALTFDGTTRPSGVMVDRLIADGVAWVASRLAPMHTSSQPAAATVSALWAAVHVERGWQSDDSSLERARDLEKTMTAMLDGLIASNAAANTDEDGDTDTVNPAVMPYWSFPPADPRYDSAGYW